MKSKDRLLAAIDHKETDRPPVFATLTPQVARELCDFYGTEYEPPLDSLLSTRISHTKVLLKMGNDAVGIALCAPEDQPTRQKGKYLVNEWGMKFINKGLYNEFAGFPLAHAESCSDIINYPFPDPSDESRYKDARDKITKYKSEYGIIADLETSIFETAWYLTGFEKLLADLLLRPGYLDPLLDRIMEINLESGRRLIQMGADIIWAGDDFGTQHGLIMDKDTWRSVFKPRIRIMFNEFKKTNPSVKIAWHTCGSVCELIPDFIELGLDILNPIQPKAAGMDLKLLKSTYGKDLVFFGGIDVQDLLPYSTPEKIRDEVTRIIEFMAKDGGYIVAPAHNIQPDTPVKNVIAFFEAITRYGWAGPY